MITAAWTAAPPMILGDLTEDDYDDSSEEPEKTGSRPLYRHHRGRYTGITQRLKTRQTIQKQYKQQKGLGNMRQFRVPGALFCISYIRLLFFFIHFNSF